MSPGATTQLILITDLEIFNKAFEEGNKVFSLSYISGDGLLQEVIGENYNRVRVALVSCSPHTRIRHHGVLRPRVLGFLQSFYQLDVLLLQLRRIRQFDSIDN
jgi:hypothetical protein